jgi:starch-binding outer membrane protein, SusD/RagB family
MKKLKITKYAVVAVLLIGFAGCNDILENVEPSTSVSPDVALTSPDGVNAVRASMYSKIRESFAYTTDYFVGPSAFTDELFIRPGASRFNDYNQAIGTSGTVHLGNWNGSYNIIQDANLLIGGVEEGVMDAETLNRYRGEAYAIRAFAYHNLVRVYGYEPGNFDQGPEGNWDLGVVIRTEPVFSVDDADLRSRSSVTEVYQQIFSDLDQARTLLAGVNANNTFATEAFAEGVAARAHLYAGDWQQAADAAQRAIDLFPGDLEDTEAGVAGMFFEDEGGHPEALFKIVVNPDTEATTGGNTFINSGPAGYTSDQWVSQLPTQFLLDQYDEDDYRLGWYAPCGEAQRIGAPAGNCTAVNDNGWSITKFNGVRGNAVDDLPYMRLAEMYLILAEASAKATNSPLAGADALDALRDARGLGPIATANPGALLSMQAFEDEILDERMRELAVEGHRFFDLKRLGRDIRFPDASRSIKMFSDSYRILAPIGTTLRNVNPELTENPGYN